MYNSVVCSTFNIRCSRDGMLEGRRVSVSGRSSAQSSVASTGRQQFKELDVRGPEGFFQPFFSLSISTVLGEWGGLYQCFTQQSGLPSIVFYDQIW